MAIRTANAEWQGPLQAGKGTMATQTGSCDGPYSFSSRMEEGAGTNPEELIAAAHAGCFSMQLSGVLGAQGLEPEFIRTEGRVQFLKQGDGWAITRIQLITQARVPGIEDGAFQEAVKLAKDICPVSKALAAVDEITVDATLET